MHVLTKSCILLLWMHTLTFVKSQDNPGACTLEDFKKYHLYDGNFDISGMQASYPGGRQVRVGCNVGYSGFFKLICVEGKWQHRGTNCQPRSCGHPGDAQFADFQLRKGDDFVFGSEVVYTCHKGFQMVSRTNFRRCMAEGWDGVIPVCEAQQCPSINVPDTVNVMGDAEEATYGNVVQFSCKSSNHILKGAREIYCDENGDWKGLEDGNPKCEAVKCEAPVIENGLILGDVKEYTEHEILNYECNPQYKRVQELPSRCTKVGVKAEWIPRPECEEIKCELTLPPLRGTTYEPAYRNRFSPGETIRVTCGERYWIVETRTLSVETTCQKNGEWAVRPVCQEVTCSRPEDGLLSYWEVSWRWESKKLGDTVRYTCRSGYKRKDGVTQATCTRDGWEPNPLCQEIKCRRKHFNNADIIGKIQAEYRYNDRVQYNCKRGYKGSFTLICREDGWYGSNECKAITGCPTTNLATNLKHLPHGDKLYFTCEDGYKFLTKGWWGEATCVDGVWSGVESCIEEQKCGDVPVIPNGEGILGSTEGQSQEMIYITCNPLYSAKIEEITCRDGRWDLNGSFDDICKPNQTCSPPPKVENAVITTPYRKQYPSGFEVTYQCRDKYTIEGNATIKCTAEKWEEINIQCILYCEKLMDESQTMDFTAEKEKYITGETIEYQCKNKAGNIGTATCQHGNWAKTTECEEKCRVPETPAGLTITTDVTDDQIRKGQHLTFACEASNHIIKGNATLECLENERWSNPLPRCEAAKDCRRSPPPLSHGRAKPGTRYPYRHNDKVEYVCDTDYSMEGGPFKTCVDGDWVGEMRCRLAHGCGRPPHLSDGDTKSRPKYQYQHNDKVEYICQQYYVMEGGPFKTCKDGEWTGEIRCLHPCTVNREDMNKHNIQFQHRRHDKLYSEHNDVIEFECKRGYRHDGAVGMRQKCEHGVIHLPTCQ
ncbi:complement factor H isoform X2 [Oreochromis niloticus]|uniref:complement factor H isoform X2 n=1 Tax=Oreochromis niloticus TaxID=8128 RepID=UPI000DF36D3F|nr:complement factor H isoform X2 [Oreochromis niloticus]